MYKHIAKDIVHTYRHTYYANVKDGFAPLGMAAQQGHLQTVQSLLQAGANINHQAEVTINYVALYLYPLHITTIPLYRMAAQHS